MKHPHSAGVEALGESPFNYDDYSSARFVHYYQTISRVLRLNPTRVLEIGPGDHVVTDFLRRKGIEVETLDNDPELHPTYLADIREPLPVHRSYDVVLASEVLEHMPFAESKRALANLAAVIADKGHVILSVPYSTVRLFPHRPDYGRLVSCEGRFHTAVPMRYLARVVPRYRLEPPPAGDFEHHHWDLGFAGSTRRQFRSVVRELFDVDEEARYLGTNCVFFVLRRHLLAGR